MSRLGKEAVKELLEMDRGRRILIDVRHMSLSSRQWYYKYIDRLRILGDNVPVVASHVGISGLSWDNRAYLDTDDDRKNKNSYLSNWKQNLAVEDIKAIVSTRGLIGISLDEQVIGGGKYFDDLEKTMDGTKQRREIQLKLVLANILTVVNSVNDPSAWNCITIGSDFDAMLDPMESYMTAEDFPQLARDIESFFENPTPVFNLYDASDVRRLMFTLTPKEIANKIMAENALRFIRNNLGVGAQSDLPEPSLTGNTTFRLRGYGNAKVVALAGEFNDWLPTKTILAKDEEGWYCKIDLNPGFYQYKFVVDDNWIVDPENPEIKDDGNGNVNSVVQVK